jgi:ABC-2 type transport system ATP-binding protein
MQPDFAIKCNALTRDFGSVRAVDGLSLEVPRGMVFGFLGPNGSGKTTTIRLLLGLLEPTAGSAIVLGKDLRRDAAFVREHSGALLEHAGLYERLSAQDNLEFFGRAYGLSSGRRAERIRELLVRLKLWDRRKEPVGTWSRGMKQRLAVARALLHRPDLVFLDEPTAGLDPVAAAALREELAGLVAQQGLTVFLTTHNLAEAEKLCAQVAVIRAGKLLATGSPEKLKAQAGGPRLEIVGRAFSTEALDALRARAEVAGLEAHDSRLVIQFRGEVDPAPLITTLVSHGAQIEEVRRSQASLEEVFLNLMEESDVS